MRTPPQQGHNGLTIIIDKPSRFDTNANYLLSGKPRQWMDEEILAPNYTLSNCDIRDTNDNSPFLPTTKRVFLLGAAACRKYSLDINRHGYPTLININGKPIPTTTAFYPQDCCDHRNIEGDSLSDEEDDAVSDRDIKDSAPTKRSNHRFWTMWHLRKALGYQVILNLNPSKLEVLTYPNLDKLYSELIGTQGEHLFLDIETSRVHQCLTCIGISTSSIWPRVYVVPIYLPTGALAYSNWTKLYKLLFTLLRNNTVVAHNASFDLLILRAFYKLPFPKYVYDTMLANHRCFPEIEKSLAHTISMWTTQPYHKDVATEVYNTQQLHKMWEYNARDVYNLFLITQAQMNYAVTIPGLSSSIAQANSMVVPYLTNSITGLPVNLAKLAATHNQLSNSQHKYSEICSILAGKSFNPGSSQQCKKFFHDTLNYPVISKSDKPPFAPKLGRKEMYQLLLKTNNPLIKAILKYRKVAKESSMLECELWTPETA